MKYKVGDRVKIKSWIQMEKEFGLSQYIDDELCVGSTFPFLYKDEQRLCFKFPDRILTIQAIKEHSRMDISYYVMENMGWNWTEEMIEYSLKEKEKEEEFRNRPVVTRFDLMDFSDEV